MLPAMARNVMSGSLHKKKKLFQKDFIYFDNFHLFIDKLNPVVTCLLVFTCSHVLLLRCLNFKSILLFWELQVPNFHVIISDNPQHAFTVSFSFHQLVYYKKISSSIFSLCLHFLFSISTFLYSELFTTYQNIDIKI